MSSPHKLALPAQAGPSGSSAQTKKRKRFKVTTNSATKASKIDFDRALDEGDDVSDTELEAPPLTGAGRRYGGRYEDEDYDEDAGVERDSGGEEGEGEDGEKKRDRDRHKRRRGDNTGSKSVEEDLGRKNKRMRGDQLMLRSLMDAEQAKRFDAFSTAVLPKAAISRLNRDLYDQRLPGDLSALLAGMAKIFVTEVVELAKELQPSTAHPTGKLRPYHLRLAREEMERRGVLGGMRLGQGTGTGTDTRSSRGMFRR